MPYTVAEVGHRHAPTRKGDGASAALLAFYMLDGSEREILLQWLNYHQAVGARETTGLPVPYARHRERPHYFQLREEWAKQAQTSRSPATSLDHSKSILPPPSQDELDRAKEYSSRVLAAIRPPDNMNKHGDPFGKIYDPAVNNGCLWQWSFDDPTVVASAPDPDIPWLPYLPGAPQSITEPDVLWLPLTPTDCIAFSTDPTADPKQVSYVNTVYRVSDSRGRALHSALQSYKSEALEAIRTCPHIPLPRAKGYILDWAFDVDTKFLRLPLPFPLHFLSHLILQRKGRVLKGIQTYLRVTEIDYLQRLQSASSTQVRPRPVFHTSAEKPYPMIQNRVGVRFQPGWTAEIVLEYARLGVPVLCFTPAQELDPRAKPRARLVDHSRLALEEAYGIFSFVAPDARTKRSLKSTVRLNSRRRASRRATQNDPATKRLELKGGIAVPSSDDRDEVHGVNYVKLKSDNDQPEYADATKTEQDDDHLAHDAKAHICVDMDNAHDTRRRDEAQEVAQSRALGADHCHFQSLEQPLPLPDPSAYESSNLHAAAMEDWLLEFLTWKERAGKAGIEGLLKGEPLLEIEPLLKNDS